MSSASDEIKVRLYYWAIRGRIQAIRYMLEDIAYTNKNVDYQEVFEPLESLMSSKWAEIKPNQKISGPYRLLPVLYWNDTDTFGQTLTIGLFLYKTKIYPFTEFILFVFVAHVIARKFNLYGKTTSKYTDPILLEGYIDGVVKAAYTDIIEKMLISMFSRPDIKNKDTFEYYPIRQAEDSLESLNMLLKQSSTQFFYDQTEPTVGDYFVFEAYLITRDINKNLVTKNCDALEKLVQIMQERPAIADYFKNGKLFKTFTAAPNEEEYLAKLAASN